MILLQIKELPAEFFTLQSMLTLTGATGAVYVISNGIQHAFDYNPKWLALVLSLLISIVGITYTTGFSVGNIFIGIVNGFLIYCTAVGATQVTGKKTDIGTARNTGNIIQSPNRRKFNTSWF